MHSSLRVSEPTWHITTGVFYRTEATSHKLLFYHQGYHFTS